MNYLAKTFELNILMVEKKSELNDIQAQCKLFHLLTNYISIVFKF